MRLAEVFYFEDQFEDTGAMDSKGHSSGSLASQLTRDGVVDDRQSPQAVRFPAHCCRRKYFMNAPSWRLSIGSHGARHHQKTCSEAFKVCPKYN